MIPVSLILVLVTVAALLGLRVLIASTISNALRRWFAQRDADGRMVDTTGLAGLGGGLPIDAGMVAQIGAGAKARMSLDTTVMRPTIGLRLLSLGVSGLILFMIWARPGVYIPTGTMSAVMTAGILFAAIRIMSYEVRYNSQTLSAPNWMFQARDFDMHTLISVRDNGHHIYKLRFDDGQSVALQKYLVGMPDFLSYARFVTELNART